MSLIFRLKKIIFNFISIVLGLFGYKIIKQTKYFEINIENFKKKNKKLTTENFINFIFEHKNLSKSQIYQDLFVDFILNEKLGGFYCEVGAADGVNLSNTFFLEKERKWKGILCEPSNFWKKQLLSNRRQNILIFKALSHKQEVKKFYQNKNNFLSGLLQRNETDQSYDVNTTTLNDIFFENKIDNIDYLSIDTEGNELQILNGLDFQRFRPKIITIEHNHVNEKAIYKKLSKNDYDLIFPYLSRFDSFYVCKKVLLDRKI